MKDIRKVDCLRATVFALFLREFLFYFALAFTVLSLAYVLSVHVTIFLCFSFSFPSLFYCFNVLFLAVFAFGF